MRIPIVDALVDRGLSARPKKIGYALRLPIQIKKGERSGRVDIPCSLSANHFSIQFPEGLCYVYGDDENEAKTKGAQGRPDPAIQVTLPDIADIDLKIPVVLGFSKNPASRSIWLPGIAVWGVIFSLSIWLTYAVGFTSLIALGITLGLTLFMGIEFLVLVRSYSKVRAVIRALEQTN